jgi:hypothetical protein
MTSPATPQSAAAPHCAHPRLARVGAIARWALAVMACLWLAFCTAVGPLYWDQEHGSIANWGWANTAFLVLSFCVCLGLIVLLVRIAEGGNIIPTAIGERLRRTRHRPEPGKDGHRAIPLFFARLGKWIIRGTNRFWKLALTLFIGWLWVPTTLLAAFGADIRSQIREFSWAWNQWTGLQQPYIGFFSFVPMDIYPTAHYMWPTDPTYLTDQHNVVLTILYGAVAAFSRYLTDSNDAGMVALAALQMLFAVFCCAATAHRFLNLPWAKRMNSTTDQPAGGMARFLIVLFFLICPLAVFSTISLTKSPLFAFAFVWWFGIWYELIRTRHPAGKHHSPGVTRLPRHSFIAFTLSTAVMLISAKYAWYIIALQIVLALIADRRRWATYVTALLIPTILIHGGISLAVGSGAIIGGDPIESRGVQLQQIARVAQRNPEGISQKARENLAPVFNLDQMADAYFQQDADPVKSSGIQAKKVSYKWRSVTPEDMDGFNKAWLEIVKANPVIAVDALFAKCYGYFNVTDQPYVSMTYYLNNDYVQKNSTWIKSYNHNWREQVAHFAQGWGSIPVLGWITHGNLYVVLTLLIGAAEVIRRRWLTLMTHIPLLLLMGVMITAPANNFERHMLPVAFVFGFVVLTYWRDSRRESQRKSQHKESQISGHESELTGHEPNREPTSEPKRATGDSLKESHGDFPGRLCGENVQERGDVSPTSH